MKKFSFESIFEKLYCMTLILGFIALFVCIFLSLPKTPERTEYPLVLNVTNISFNTDTVLFVDNDGNLWSARGIEDFEIGDECAAIMDSKGTDEIFDDEIVTIKRCNSPYEERPLFNESQYELF